MGRPRPRPVVLDAGVLIALEKRSTKMEALLRKAQEVRATIIIPAGVLAQVWSGDAGQVLAARKANAVVVTGDAADLRHLDEALPLEIV